VNGTRVEAGKLRPGDVVRIGDTLLELDDAPARTATGRRDARTTIQSPTRSGDYLLAKKDGAIGEDHILGELGDLLLGRFAARRSADDVTLYKSLGIAVQDLAAAHYVYNQAVARGGGVSVPLGA
jgi:ornithine cyclodeaminase/alanine dehydrogenase-like protein (mu-crystallin family)